MRSPMAALVWEQWRQIRVFVISATVIAASIPFIARLLKLETVVSDGEIAYATVLVALLFVGSLLLFMHSSVNDIRTGLPDRMLTLPVRPSRIAIAQIGFRYALIAGTALTICVLRTLVDSFYATSIVPTVVTSLTAFAYASTLAWTIGRKNVGAFLGITLLTIAIVLATISYLDYRVSRDFGTPYLVKGLFIASCAIISYRSIVRVRKPARVYLVVNDSEKPLGELSALGSPVTGHFWYEWKNVGWVAPVVFAATGILFIPITIIAVAKEPRTDYLLTFWIFICFQIGMFLIGIVSARASRGTWTLPIRVQDAVLHRMKAMSVSLFLVHAMWTILILLVAFLAGQSHTLTPADFAIYYVLSFAVGWCIVWAPYLPLLFWFSIMVYAVYEKFTPAVISAETILVWLPSLIFLPLLASCARHCYQRQLFTPKVVLDFTLLGIPLFPLVIAALSNEHIFGIDNLRITVALVASLMPLFCLLSQGVFLDRMRHGVRFKKLPPRTTTDSPT